MKPIIMLFLAACSVGVCACRRYAPVERHFLRVPAGYAAELSGIDREKWLTRARKASGAGKRAKEENYLKLPAETLPGEVKAPEGEVKFFPNEAGSRQGMVALHWPGAAGLAGNRTASGADQAGGQLWLLKTEGGRYVPQPLTRWLPAGPGPWRYQLNRQPDAITAQPGGTGRTGAPPPPLVLHWRGGRWVRNP